MEDLHGAGFGFLVFYRVFEEPVHYLGTEAYNFLIASIWIRF